ncbi:MAG TPA: methylated-DNA--[protein]-cysteine S-methyltransferase [Sphingobacteriaceae bacterium]|nr:methylated-DNA--[protein]-cysteine S-methyltransferase [Sphingobacteriaceae bacterium]
MTIKYGVFPCTLGRILVAANDEGVCFISLGDDDRQLEQELSARFADEGLEQDADAVQRWAEPLQEYLRGQMQDLDIPLAVTATPFQQRVWREVARIPRGATRTYKEVAAAVGKPGAARAVARACAANPVAVVVPCHRVVRTDGSISGFRWGIQRKLALLAMESGQAAT